MNSQVTHTDSLRKLDQSHHLHPFTDLRAYSKQGGRIVSQAEHIYITDTDGKQILDGMSGLWCCSLGYSQRSIIEAVYEQLQQLPYYNNFFNCSNQPSIELAKALVDITPEHYNHVFFTNSGSESADTSLKMARAYWRLKGQPAKTKLIGRAKGYHGVNFGGISVGGIGANRKMFGTAVDADHL